MQGNGNFVVHLLCCRNYMNDSLRTNVFVRFQAETIACACIYLAARVLQVQNRSLSITSACLLWDVVLLMSDFSHHSFFQISLPSRPLWYLLFGATEEEIKDICTTTLKLYTRKKVRSVLPSLMCYFESVSDFFLLFVCLFFSQIMNSWRRKWTRGRWLYRKPNWKPKDWIQMALLLSPHWVDSLLDPNHVSYHFHYLLCSLTALLLSIVYHRCSKHTWLFVCDTK